MILDALTPSDAFVRALGWTLAHSLWQGALAALALLILLPRLKTAHQRFWAAYGGLLALLVAAVLTFALAYSPAASGSSAELLSEQPALSENAGFEGLALEAAPASWGEEISEWLDANHSIIVALWLFGFAFFLLRLAGGFLYVERLRRREVQVPDVFWTEKMGALARQLSLSRPVLLFESALASVPMTLGYFKPIILLPLGLVNQLSMAEVEAILAHELAHIARRDWLLNLVQAFIEALFYYHPAVWWLSNVARAERENCCDDLAVRLTGNRLVYAKALMRTQEIRRPASVAPTLALGLDGNSSAIRRRQSPRLFLLERIQRILNQQQKQRSQAMEKAIATAILAAFIGLWGLRAHTVPVVTALSEMAFQPLEWLAGDGDQAAQVSPTDTIPPKAKRTTTRTQKIVSEEDGKRVELETQNGEITHLNVDGKDVPPAEFEKYSDVTDALLEEMPTPPAPPAPPHMPHPFWGEMAPPAPPGSPATPFPAMPPTPPFPPVPPKLSTDKDAQGNTIIRLDGQGEPMEIIVKEGKVWIDGKEVPAGETMDLPGLGGDPRVFYFNGDGGAVMHFEPGESFRYYTDVPEVAELSELKDLPELREQLARTGVYTAESLREAQVQMERSMKDQRKVLKEQGKDWKKQEKEWRKQNKNWEKEYKGQMEQAQRALEEMRYNMDRTHGTADRQREHSALLGYYRAQGDAQESLSEVLKNEMQRDGLLPDPGNFSIDLSNKELKVNGKKQSESLHKKYMELYQGHVGKPMEDGDNVKIQEEN